MNGIPKLDALRSISLYGLSSVTMNFEYDTDPYFARAAGVRAHSRRRGARRRHAGDVAALQPERPDLPLRAPEPRSLRQELKILEDWVLERQYRADPGRRRRLRARRRRRCSTRCSSIRTSSPSYGVNVAQVVRAARREQRQRRRRLLLAGRPVLLRARARPGPQTLEDIGNIVVADARRHSGVREGRRRRSPSATRRGSASSGSCKQNDAVEGVILMRVGEQAQVVLKRVEAMTDDAEQARVLPPDVKIVPYYDRTDLIEETTRDGRDEPACAACCSCSSCSASSSSASARR